MRAGGNQAVVSYLSHARRGVEYIFKTTVIICEFDLSCSLLCIK